MEIQDLKLFTVMLNCKEDLPFFVSYKVAAPGSEIASELVMRVAAKEAFQILGVEEICESEDSFLVPKTQGVLECSGRAYYGEMDDS